MADVSIICFDDFTDIDVFLMWDLLNRVPKASLNVRLLGHADMHRSRTGIELPMHGSWQQSSTSDAVLVASGPGVRKIITDSNRLKQLHLYPKQQLVGSICSGSLMLAALGLLDGRAATTYPSSRPILEKLGARVVTAPFVECGSIATAASCLSAVQLCQWVVSKLIDVSTATKMAQSLQPVGSAPPMQPEDSSYSKPTVVELDPPR